MQPGSHGAAGTLAPARILFSGSGSILAAIADTECERCASCASRLLFTLLSLHGGCRPHKQASHYATTDDAWRPMMQLKNMFTSGKRFTSSRSSRMHRYDAGSATKQAMLPVAEISVSVSIVSLSGLAPLDLFELKRSGRRGLAYRFDRCLEQRSY